MCSSEARTEGYEASAELQVCLQKNLALQASYMYITLHPLRDSMSEFCFLYIMYIYNVHVMYICIIMVMKLAQVQTFILKLQEKSIF